MINFYIIARKTDGFVRKSTLFYLKGDDYSIFLFIFVVKLTNQLSKTV